MSGQVDVTDWKTAERVLASLPEPYDWAGCSSLPPSVILGPWEDSAAARCQAPVVARVLTRWPGPYGETDPEPKPRKWPLCAKHLAWHLTSDLERQRLIVGIELTV